MTTTNEIIIDNILYNTKIENDRRFIGLYFEKKLLTHLINNNIKIEHISNDNKYSPYDFIIRCKETIYIVELKSRLGSIKHHNCELMSYSKICKYKKICNKNDKIRCIFIFNHIDIDNNNINDYYYYEINFDDIDDICFKLNDNTYELGIRHLKSLSEFIEILKK